MQFFELIILIIKSQGLNELDFFLLRCLETLILVILAQCDMEGKLKTEFYKTAHLFLLEILVSPIISNPFLG